MSDPSTMRSSPWVPGTRSSSSRSRICSKISPTFIDGIWFRSWLGTARGEHAVEVRGGLARRALPGERLGELASLCAEPRDERCIAREARHGGGHRARIAVRNEVARLAVVHRLADSW